MAAKVLDSWALMALFNEEAGADEVETLLAKAENGTHRLFMCVVNWGEIYYSVCRGVSQEAAEQTAREIAAMPIEIVAADLQLTRQAAIYKAGGRLAYADCFAAALAKTRNADLVTGDREFRRLEKEIRIAWLK